MRHIDHFWASPHAQSIVVSKRTTFEYGFPGHAATLVSVLWGEPIRYHKWIPGDPPPPPDHSVPPDVAWAGCPEASSYAPPGAEGVDASFAGFLGVFTAYVTIRGNTAWALSPGHPQLEAYKP